MAHIIKEYIISFFRSFFTKWLEDFFILTGIGVVIATTYKINTIVGHYMLGIFFILFGLIIAKARH